VAAVDLGSNSFHLIVARATGSRLMVVDRLKDMVRLAAGLDDDKRLDPDVMQRALDCLARFGQRLKELPPENVRVVGTNTLRKARNGSEFVARAREALGHEVEIISGREEARLIYLGVSHSLEDNCDRRLVVDIGGGSTEVIIGRQFRPEHMESMYIGCVGTSRMFFGDGRITAAAMDAAVMATRRELEPLEAGFRNRGWDSAIGASGTILSIQDVIAADGGSREEIGLEALEALRERLVRIGSVEDLGRISGLPGRRAPVFPGGVAILTGLFRSLGIERMAVSSGALREGLLWDLLGRRHQGDIRERTVDDLALRYHVDVDHARRVRDTAMQLLAAVAGDWELDAQELGPLLRRAARLHEIGMDIAHSQYHKHGSYLLQHMDMPGFSRTEQRRLGLLVRSHRRKFPDVEFDAAGADDTGELRRLSLLLRCAVILHRARSPHQAPPISRLRADRSGLELIFPPGWLRAHPLTRLDLAEEERVWKAQGKTLTFTDQDAIRG
jgi:exopolyphosphatase/guanosine-5'-triphosphate,3'-diphosphate pyrophosphatase